MRRGTASPKCEWTFGGSSQNQRTASPWHAAPRRASARGSRCSCGASGRRRASPPDATRRGACLLGYRWSTAPRSTATTCPREFRLGRPRTRGNAGRARSVAAAQPPRACGPGRTRRPSPPRTPCTPRASSRSGDVVAIWDGEWKSRRRAWRTSTAGSTSPPTLSLHVLRQPGAARPAAADRASCDDSGILCSFGRQFIAATGCAGSVATPRAACRRGSCVLGPFCVRYAVATCCSCASCASGTSTCGTAPCCPPAPRTISECPSPLGDGDAGGPSRSSDGRRPFRVERRSLCLKR